MIELIELNTLIRKEAPEVAAADYGLSISRNTDPESWRGLPLHLQQRLADVLAQLNQQIPDRFDYTIDFGDEEPRFSLSYEDGVQIGTFGYTRELKAHESIADHFAKVDWEEEAGAAMQQCQIFDELKEYAEIRPERIPSTKSLQRTFRDDVKPWIKEVRNDRSKVFVRMFSETQGLLTQEFPDMEAFRIALPDLMTVQLHVLGVVAEGKPLPVKRIDLMKRAALEWLKDMPMSYAKASGKFSELFAPVEEGEGEI